MDFLNISLRTVVNGRVSTTQADTGDDVRKHIIKYLEELQLIEGIDSEWLKLF